MPVCVSQQQHGGYSEIDDELELLDDVLDELLELEEEEELLEELDELLEEKGMFVRSICDKACLDV
jgi:hypothetical protein